jgi:hypothetical protein
MPNSCAGHEVFVQEPHSLAPIPEKHILHDMIRFLRKWLLIRRLSLIMRSNIKQGNGFVIWHMKMRVIKGAFAEQMAARLLRSRLFGKKYEHRKFLEIMLLLDESIADGYVEAINRPSDNKCLIRNAAKGEQFCGIGDFLQEFFTKYDKVWRTVIVPLSLIVSALIANHIWPTLRPSAVHSLEKLLKLIG